MTIKYKITPNNVTVYDSYKIRTYSDMVWACGKIRTEASLKGITYKRTIASWITEWQAHNFLYDHHLFVSHTKDVDLNENETPIRLFAYSILSLFYHE